MVFAVGVVSLMEIKHIESPEFGCEESEERCVPLLQQAPLTVLSCLVYHSFLLIFNHVLWPEKH